jgi:hypothetical protein
MAHAKKYGHNSDDSHWTSGAKTSPHKSWSLDKHEVTHKEGGVDTKKLTEAEVESLNTELEMMEELFWEEMGLSEEVEQIDELSGATLGSYIQKAHADVKAKHAHFRAVTNHPSVTKYSDKLRELSSKGSHWSAAQRKKDNAAKEKLYSKIDDAQKKLDPDFHNSIDTRRRHDGIAKAVNRLQTGKKLTEEQEEILNAALEMMEELDNPEQQVDEAG